VYAALDGKEIIGYAMGHLTILTTASSLNAAGETAFVLDELYVRQSCRGKGVGKALFRFMENDVRDDVDVIDLIAASCRHADLLRFYIDELGMTFRYAGLSKRTKP
jgi:GNAT superfamily N-acetyltransferase